MFIKGLQKDLHQHEVDFKQRIKKFRLMDDEFMTLVFDGNIEVTELLLHIIVIFITEQDVIGKGFPIYHLDRWINETKEQVGDGSHILYVNGAYNDESDAIGKLMHDFKCTMADEMHFKILADRVRYFKETKGGLGNMSEIMEELYKEGVDEGGRNKSIKVAELMLQDGFEFQSVAKYSGLSVEEIEELAQGKSA